MLQTLRVKNFAIVDDLCVEFQPGFNVITGETGAGKSILIGALSLLLGERSDREMIRSGEDQCGVEGSFILIDPSHCNEILNELGLPPCDEGRLVIRRIISTACSQKILINDSPATLQTLKRLGTVLVDLHGPHAHQSLLERCFQLSILDSYGGLKEFFERYSAGYNNFRSLLSQRPELEKLSHEDISEQIELLEFQTREIKDANLSEDDEAKLQREHALVANARRIIELAGAIRSALTEEDSSAFNGLALANLKLRELAQLLPDAKKWVEEAESLCAAVQELSDSVGRALQDAECDPGHLQVIEERLALVHKLKRKYGESVKAVLERLQNMESRLAELKDVGKKLAELDEKISQARQAALSGARKLSIARRKCADSLAREVESHLHDLGFPHGSFAVRIEEAELSPTGTDNIEFGFAPNAGETMRPLRSIASSGEISRVMLAVKSVLSEHDRIPVLVFDEIDANVGGEMGLAIGKKLAALTKKHQVICITHLPQVAVYAKTHWLVTKHIRNGRTSSMIQLVQNEARVEEIARMSGGRDLTSVALKHAREMLAQVKEP